MEFCPFADQITTVISGKQRSWDRIKLEWVGADYWGEQWAADRNIPIIEYPADWGKHGRSAGPIRNKAMVDKCDALVLAWDGVSAGSKNILAAAQRKGLKYPDSLFVHVFYVGKIY